MSARVIARARCEIPLRYSVPLGAMSGQFPSGSGWSMPSHIRFVEPLAPACPSWRPIFAGECSCTKRTIRAQASRCAAVHIPGHHGVMRASGAGQVISVMIKPAPPVARAPRCTRCQSLGVPSGCALY
jgi:hypothetical protein